MSDQPVARDNAAVIREALDEWRRSAEDEREYREIAEALAALESLQADAQISYDERVEYERRVLAAEEDKLAAEREAASLREKLERIGENARAWHGSEGLGTGHTRALGVIAAWVDEALAGSGGGTEGDQT